MRLSHSISITFLVSTFAALPACGSEEASDDGGASGTSGTAGAATGGTGGAATGGAGGAATGGSGGAATGGAGGAATGGSGGGGVVDHPGSSQAEIEAFLMMETYKTTGMGWRPEAMPGDDAALPHLATNRYFNETIIASKAAGNHPPTLGPPHSDGSMSVKELLVGTTVVGKAATLRAGTTNVYYCKASVAERCGTGSSADVAVYGTGTVGACGCHGGGSNLSHDAIP